MSFKFVLVLPIFLLIACEPSGTKEVPAKAPDANQIVSVELKDGDIIFHESKSDQSEAIQLATRSRYSHCGILFGEKGKLYVLEAVDPVKKTPLVEWIARGRSGHYVVKRLKDADRLLTAKALKKMKAAGVGMLGKPYDRAFEWTDEKIYCSELVWKLYYRATGLQIGQLQTLGDFDLSSRTVRSIVKSRYGNHIPLQETVISPASIFESDQLETIEDVK